MNDIDKKLFEDAMKKVEADPGLNLFKDLDSDLPPASAFMVDESGEYADDAIIEKLSNSVTPKQDVRAKNHNRRILYTLAPVAACACIIFAVLFANGPQNANSSGGAALDISEMAGWDTAGDEYSALYEKIEAYKSEVYRDVLTEDMSLGVMGDAAPAASADVGAPEAPVSDPLTPVQAPDASPPEPGEGTSGSGYEDYEGTDLPPAVESEENISNDQSTPEFSDTNEQVSGVREADIVKTDGKYIYAINSNKLSVVDVSGDEMKLVSDIPQTTVSDGQVYFEMYLAGDRLIAIRHGYNTSALARIDSSEADIQYEEGTAGSGYIDKPTCIIYPIGGYFTDTSVDIFDISNKEEPKLLNSLSQSGDYSDSRMIDGNLYLITNYYGGDISQIDKNDPRTFVPLYSDNGEQLIAAPSDIILPDGDTWPSFTLVSGIDATGSGTFTSKKSVYGESSTVYCSTQAVYITRAEYNYEEIPSGEFIKSQSSAKTVITKASLNNGQIDIAAVNSVPGVTLNQFSLDEYNGVLRIVTTNDQNTWYNFRDVTRPGQNYDWSKLPESIFNTSNALYTLDNSLNILGKIENLAPEERVYSCRFMGNIAYFVTFRQTDPLFSVDLSNPSQPKVLDALKIPGFSEYLHPYAEGELFGLGRDADADTGRQRGLKLTMFDNSNPADLKEKTTHLVENQDSYSSAETNHKAILVNASRSIIAFPIQQWEDAGPLSRYLIYSYSAADGFSKVAEITIDTGEPYNFAELRGLFIGNTFYVVGPNSIGAYAMDAGFQAFAEKQILRIDEDATSINRYSYHPPGVIVPLNAPVIGVVE